MDLGAVVSRFPNGTISLTWRIPPGLQHSDSLSVEINWGEGFIPVTPGLHTPANLDPKQEHTVELRLRNGGWEGLLYVPIPLAASSEEETDEPASRAEVAVLYSVIFGTIIVSCFVLIIVILGLKYIQWSRRDSDKGRQGYGCGLWARLTFPPVQLQIFV